MELRAEVYTRKQLESALSEGIGAVYAPYDMLDGGLSGEADRIIAVPPVFLADCEDKVRGRLEKLREAGFYKALAHTVGHIELLGGIGYEIYGGARLNCANSDALKFFYEQGARDIIVSAELTVSQINRLEKPCKTGFIAYGHIPLMITRRCPIADGKPCGKENCGGTLTDRTGRRMNVICSENTAEILNSDVLDLGDRLDKFGGADFAVLKFTVETDVKDVISAYREGRRASEQAFTRGLYFRGTKSEV